jgi:hypothetical protein
VVGKAAVERPWGGGGGGGNVGCAGVKRVKTVVNLI